MEATQLTLGLPSYRHFLCSASPRGAVGVLQGSGSPLLNTERPRALKFPTWKTLLNSIFKVKVLHKSQYFLKVLLIQEKEHPFDTG